MTDGDQIISSDTVPAIDRMGAHPDPDGSAARSSVRFSLWLGAFGLAVAGYAQVTGGDEYLVISGVSLAALGFGGAGLLKMLFK